MMPALKIFPTYIFLFLVCRDGIDADTIAELEQMLEARRKELLAEGAPEEG